MPGGRDVYEVPLPAVVTVKEGLNLPRYPSVPGRLRAKRKPLEASRPQPQRGAHADGAHSSCPRRRARRSRSSAAAPEAAPAVVELLRELGVMA